MKHLRHLKRVKRPYWLMVLFGFLSSLALILASIILAWDVNFYVPLGLGIRFILSYYIFSLTFFVAFIASVTAVSAKMRASHGGKPHRWFWLSLLSFTAGSVLGSAAFLAFALLFLS